MELSVLHDHFHVKMGFIKSASRWTFLSQTLLIDQNTVFKLSQ